MTVNMETKNKHTDNGEKDDRKVPYPLRNLILYRIKISRNHIQDPNKLFNLTLKTYTLKTNTLVMKL